jgi:BirA family transcriptional regulator, biotin operon repressor / biotin---[acetyl-CoA-carboxylase] ligase
MELDESAVAAGLQLVALDAVDSTNKIALERARRGGRVPLWITAATQSHGRGRGGRVWVSPPGNLYASLLLFDPSPPERAPELAFVAALAARDAVVAEAPQLAAGLGFKWPNDLLLAGEKCAGILIEGEVGAQKDLSVVIGVGVNCAHYPARVPDHAPAATGGAEAAPADSADEPLLYPATSLAAHDAAVGAEQLFTRLSATMARRIAQWDRGNGFAAILGDWLMAVRGIGESIVVRNGKAEKTGRFVGIDQAGRLVLELAGGRLEKISAGDVFPFAQAGGWRLPGLQA